MPIRSTHTYVTLGVSAQTYKEIRDKLVAADYGHTFLKDMDNDEVIDMRGIALQEEHVEDTAGLPCPGEVWTCSCGYMNDTPLCSKCHRWQSNEFVDLDNN